MKIKGTYTITAEPRNKEEEEKIQTIGFKKESKKTPYTIKTDKSETADFIIKDLNVFGYEGPWALTKK